MENTTGVVIPASTPPPSNTIATLGEWKIVFFFFLSSKSVKIFPFKLRSVITDGKNSLSPAMYIYVSRLAFLFFLIAEKRTATFNREYRMNRSFARLSPPFLHTYVRTCTVQKLEKSRAHIKCSANLHNILSGSVAVMLINLFTRWKIHRGRLDRLHAEVNPVVSGRRTEII